MKFGKIALLALSASAILGVSSVVSPVGSLGGTQEVQADSNLDISAYRKSNINTINTIRTSNGLPAFNENSTLDSYAQERAEYLANLGHLDHHAGKDESRIVPYNAVSSENLAMLPMGNRSNKSVQAISNEAVTTWWEDTGIANYGHRKTILDAFVDSIGAGVAQQPGTENYVVVIETGIDKSSLDALVAQNSDFYYKQYAPDFNGAGLGSYAKYSWDEKSGLADVNVPDSNTSHIWLLDIATLSGYHTLDVVSNNQALYSQTGKVSNRMLGSNTSWYTDKVAIDPQGNQYFRVSTDEWVKRTSDIAFH
ncbi:CAP domain-containing protein [Companilactobacillus sp.]|jgi:uncharacterized protein YkwD|uniref:CAP domain-containing protein n=1 Tax=Companilactobacillus sp. TaxID=2767905 RepID=UPI0025B7FA89|nr:CAP domain-containing protein [Companilactobacillus sp.]MCH4009759.1 CAP domain-containing protein [Companilactobacillus sp.]MCH4052565.1 CAP domain-containing protein [Companilactobacillus sp.]MCH4077701.1 CAP domain-containing protein [Companilactobacillus sp.]MCH4126277.1 CAP domain-containing protein [Companilactobacillus sp.]MCI1311985.1 CAP domain-containing protein [Companilactobacillus sp.]